MKANTNTITPSCDNLSLETTQSGLPTTPPSSVDEFRARLKQYFVVVVDGDGEEYLYVRDMPFNGIPLASLEGFADLYKLCGAGWSGDGSSPEIAPLADLEKDPFAYMFGGWKEGDPSFFQDPDNFTLRSKMMDMDKPIWVSLDNQVWREYFITTLGDFSGYCWRNEEVK